MIDFKRLASAKEPSKAIDPREIFDSLPKPISIDDLHDSQAKVLDGWFSSRDKRDTVIKLNTGGGKTLVGLLIAVSSARELGRGALYLVETKQLASQVCDQARAIGISAVEYSGKPSITSNFRNGQTVLVASYQALFNGLSAFGTSSSREPEEVSAIIIDDAHSSFDVVRDAFTVSVYARDDVVLFKQLCAPFRASFESLDRQTTFDEFSSGGGSNSDEVLEIPFWAWLDNCEYISSLLSKKWLDHEAGNDDTSNSMRFAWPLIKDELKYCQATLSRDAFSIAPYLPLIGKFPTFTRASRRIYMSATFADEGAIIRTFGCKKDDINLLAPTTLAGVGRRMILMCDGSESTKAAIADRMKSLAASGRGAVVLEPSFLKAEQWSSLGVDVIRASDAPKVVDSLRAGAYRKPVVFANRYNGLDLPGDACRLLVVSGLPTGMSDNQKLLSDTLSYSRVYARTVAQSIEQAIGRGTRGSGDYCVVVLFGHDLCEWVKDTRHLQLFSLATQAQILCGETIVAELPDEDALFEAIEQGLDDDQDFASYLAGFVADYVKNHDEMKSGELEQFAITERKAIVTWHEGKTGDSVQRLLSFSRKETFDSSLRGYVLHLAANVEYSCGEYEQARQLQDRAHSFNNALYKAAFSSPSTRVSGQTRSVLDVIEMFESTGRDIIAAFDSETVALAENSREADYLMALEALGKYLGAESKRFDKNGKGPDVAWLFEEDGLGIAIEAKNEKLPKNALSKRDYGQQLVAEKWLDENYPNLHTRVAVSVHPNDEAYDNASATGSLVIELTQVAAIRSDLRLIIYDLISAQKTRESRLAQCENLLVSKDLTARQIVEKRAKHFKRKTV